MLLTAALVRGFQVLTEQTAGEFMRALAVLSVLLFSAAVFGGSILAFVLMIYRFYKNLMTDEGYLMFTLPVTTGQLIWSKMIVSAVWLLATAAMDVLSMFISVFDLSLIHISTQNWQTLRRLRPAPRGALFSRSIAMEDSSLNRMVVPGHIRRCV